MAEYAEDPSLLTKEKLKNELIANNIVLPSGQHPKDVYVQLYRQHLSSRNRATPEFSSDEERESTPVRGRGRPPGRKATKKTDKPTVEGKNDQDITSLSNDALKEELLKYGVKPGPILGSTRKVYEQRLLKLKEQQDVVSIAPPVAELSTADNKQNGNTDSTQYSDNDEPRTDLAFEPREPLRSKPKAQVASRSKRLEQNEIVEDAEVLSELNVKRSNRRPPKDVLPEIEELTNISADADSESQKMLESEKGGRLQAVFKETTKVTRRTPRKRVVTAEPIDDADNSEAAPIPETVLPSSNQPLANAGFSQFESRQVDYQVTENFKHANALRSVSEFTDLSRRTPKKQLISEKVFDVQNVGHTDPSDVLNTAVIEDTGNISDHRLETPNKTRQLKITKFVTPIKKQIIEKTFTEEKREERDILKQMFPYETTTPTGISASCRRPIKGASGRPFNLKDYKDYKLEESYSSKYLSKYQPVIEEKTSTKGKSGRSIPIWIKFIILLILVVLGFLVYQAMESNAANPFAKWLQGNQNLNKEEN
ncbi:thymopoietin isoform X1 [Hyla sarda]|uniref:thymopoietin isoform X1 n=1 Tax=Hyla sarda TaxID=327740 RepID=UPI0024C2E42D|nr:thymopoietin isoform X1 [Hyla sarda]